MKVNGKSRINVDSTSAAGSGGIGVTDADARVLDRSSFHGRRFQGETPFQLLNWNSGLRTQNSKLAKGALVGSLTIQQHEWPVTDARKGESV